MPGLSAQQFSAYVNLMPPNHIHYKNEWNINTNVTWSKNLTAVVPLWSREKPREWLMSEVSFTDVRDRTVPDVAPSGVNDWNHAVIVNSLFFDSELCKSFW